jgi:hypothetical protein
MGVTTLFSSSYSRLAVVSDLVHFDSYSHLFMEQSSVGFNIGNMFKCLRALREVDVATFRCFHQIANILEGTTHRDVLDHLIDQANTGSVEDTYTNWSEAASGDGIKYCEDVDKQEWDDRDVLLRKISESTFLYSAPTEKDISELKMIESAYRQEVYGWENAGVPPSQWPEIIGEAKDIEHLLKSRNVYLPFLDVDSPLTPFLWSC